MTSNLMQQYTRIIETFLTNFTKAFLSEKYNEKISKGYIETYIEARIYNFGEEEQRFFYRRIYETLVNKKKELKKEYEEEQEQEILEKNLKMYQFIFYADDVRQMPEISEFVRIVCEKREKEFELAAIRGLDNRLIKIIKDFKEQKQNFLESYNTKDFSLDIEKYTLIDNTYKVNISYNFKLPYIYSNQVIDEVYTGGTINEDRLIIEYMLLTIVCIKDINNGNFATKYLVEFADSLYKKAKKIRQTLRVIDNVAIQDKIILKITYQNFQENKELIYDLMQEGFKFAIIIDDTFNTTDTNLRKLNIFEYMLVPEDSKNYEPIKDKERTINNTIIYDK